jgi:hypothetical protein
MTAISLLLLGASLLASGVLAEVSGVVSGVSYTAKLTHHGVEIPLEFTSLPARHSLPDKKSESTTGKRTSVSTTANWAGAIQEAPSSGLFQTVSANWQVPSVSAPPGTTLGTDLYWLYEWVGIDSSCDVILQAGTGAYVRHSLILV